MGTFTKGEIVLFPFPYIDLSNRKLRPCLALSDEMGDDILLCQITSKKIRKDQYTVEIKKDETINGSLQIDSYIRSNMIFTSSKSQIVKKVCRINDNKYKKVTDIIFSIITK